MKIALLLLFLASAVSAGPKVAPAAPPASRKTGAALLKTDILAVFAHPDDEIGASATLAAYALGKGKVVATVYCTRGEGCGNTVGTQWGAALGILREAELRDSLAHLGAPDDIRAHWRSDSVEICLDPAGGAENTLGCFKVGISPFDTTGKVRAARDADTNEGPIEKTAPAMRLVSKRTPTGYRIQAAIPFSEIGVSLAKGERLGFNVIIYDGDKRDAAIGENINKSRIVSFPRPGVQGRPEDWGRIDLE